jgi:hypothetical protein
VAEFLRLRASRGDEGDGGGGSGGGGERRRNESASTASKVDVVFKLRSNAQILRSISAVRSAIRQIKYG